MVYGEISHLFKTIPLPCGNDTGDCSNNLDISKTSQLFQNAPEVMMKLKSIAEKRKRLTRLKCDRRAQELIALGLFKVFILCVF